MAKTAKKKVSKKASVTALPATDSIPEGFEKIGGGYAPTWKPEEQKTIHGKVTGGVRDIELTIRKEKRNVRCMEVTQKKTGVALTVWESASLRDLFDHIVETGEGPEVFIRFDGHGKKKPGMNPAKLFTVAVKD